MLLLLKNSFHKKVLNSSSDEVLFPGAIYDEDVVLSLRFYALAYLHGHQVGGTNPSLVEAMGCGSPIIAHDNKFNRWVAGDGAVYFSDKKDCQLLFDELLTPEAEDRLRLLSNNSRRRHAQEFTLEKILADYERVCRE